MEPDIAEQLARRDRLRKYRASQLTPEQRMERFWALQEYGFAEMMKSPGAFERFWRRNLKKRAVPPRDDTTPLPG